MKLTDYWRKIYDEARSKNLDILVEKGFCVDPALKAKKDDRYTFSIFGYYPKNFYVGGSKNFERELKKIFPNQIYYTADPKLAEKSAGLHFTFMQLLGFAPNLKVSRTRLYKYIDVCGENLFLLGGPLKVDFFGLLATPVNILWTGVTNAAVNEIRENIRSAAANADLPLTEPYKVTIIHSSILRYLDADSLTTESVLDFCDRYRTGLRAECVFDKLYLGFGSALMKPSEIKNVAEFDLAGRKVKVLHD